MRTCGWALLLSSVLALPANAQETRGNISGTVKDAQGVVPGATVTITSLDTGGVSAPRRPTAPATSKRRCCSPEPTR